MPTHQRSRKNLPPLAIGTAYVAADFERFEYFGLRPAGSAAILRLHLKNETTIDLPTNDDELKRLLCVLCDAFRSVAIEHLLERGWIQKSS